MRAKEAVEKADGRTKGSGADGLGGGHSLRRTKRSPTARKGMRKKYEGMEGGQCFPGDEEGPGVMFVRLLPPPSVC